MWIKNTLMNSTTEWKTVKRAMTVSLERRKTLGLAQKTQGSTPSSTRNLRVTLTHKMTAIGSAGIFSQT